MPSLKTVSAKEQRLPSYPAYKGSGVEWLGEIPEDWNIGRLQHGATIHLSSVDKKSSDDEIPVRLCNYTDVYYGSHIVDASGFMKATATPSEIKRHRLREGDVIVTKDSESRDDIAVPAVSTRDFDDVVCGYHLAQIRPGSNLHGPYLYYGFLSPVIGSQFEASATGITRYAIGYADLKSSLFPFPPLPEQRAIAAFLDRETEKIDALIEKKQRLIERLEEKRTALISHTVTKGLNPDGEMKDSGVEWLGEIPVGWGRAKIRHICQVSRGASPRPIDDPKYFDKDGEYAWVRISDVTASNKYLTETEQTLSEKGQSKSVSIEPGELFLSIAATVGKPIITKIKCCIHDGFVYFNNLDENKDFIYFLFLGGELYKGVGKKGTQLNLNTDSIGDIKIPLPPLSEQFAIAAFLDRETESIDALIEKVRNGISRLQEYRTALISAAVTGKIDVRDAVSPSEVTV